MTRIVLQVKSRRFASLCGMMASVFLVGDINADARSHEGSVPVEGHPDLFSEAPPTVLPSPQPDQAGGKSVPRQFGRWTLEKLKYVGGEKIPNQCVITQGSVRIITSSGRVTSVELDRPADGSGIGLSNNRQVSSIYLDGVHYRIRHVASKAEVPSTDGPIIDDPVIQVFFSHEESNLKPIADLALKLDGHKRLRVIGLDGKEISNIKLNEFDKLKRICGL